jgi:hypothetical protein
MSIPFFFVPQQVDGRRVYDGGLRNNFPVTQFQRDHPNTPFIALYLRAATKDRRWPFGELIDIVIDGNERTIVDAHSKDVVVIDTSPISTTDFGISAVEKDFLVKAGQAAALVFLHDRKLDGGPDRGTVDAALTQANDCRAKVVAFRRRRRIVRTSLYLVLVLFVYYIPSLWRIAAAALMRLSN